MIRWCDELDTKFSTQSVLTENRWMSALTACEGAVHGAGMIPSYVFCVSGFAFIFGFALGRGEERAIACYGFSVSNVIGDRVCARVRERFFGLWVRLLGGFSGWEGSGFLFVGVFWECGRQ